ncbi:hypothetical protein WK00_01815 [Burkholderia ubonensis]|nr:hypothetical protein WK00_01815 [Burkholderia ubonensis]
MVWTEPGAASRVRAPHQIQQTRDQLYAYYDACMCYPLSHYHRMLRRLVDETLTYANCHALVIVETDRDEAECLALTNDTQHDYSR